MASDEFRCDEENRQGKKAIAVFARAPAPGQVKTRLAQGIGSHAAAQLYAAMLRDTLHLAQRAATSLARCEVVLSYTPRGAFDGGAHSLNDFWSGARLPQCDGDLGERMLDCVAQLRRRGAAQIVLLGSDTPDLPPERITRAFEMIDDAPQTVENSPPTPRHLAFGPAQDGGFYLMALNEAASAPAQIEKIFDGVGWSAERTLQEVSANAERMRLRAGLLSQWRDVDTLDDLRSLQERLARGESQAPATQRCLGLMQEWGLGK